MQIFLKMSSAAPHNSVHEKSEACLRPMWPLGWNGGSNPVSSSGSSPGSSPNSVFRVSSLRNLQICILAREVLAISCKDALDFPLIRSSFCSFSCTVTWRLGGEEKIPFTSQKNNNLPGNSCILQNNYPAPCRTVASRAEISTTTDELASSPNFKTELISISALHKTGCCWKSD